MKSSTEGSEGSKAAATLAGGVEVDAQFMDGRVEKVFVRQLRVKEYPALFSAIQDEGRQLEIFCKQPAGWAETLTPTSHNTLMKAGEELNKEPFFDWSARRIACGRALAPDMVNTVMQNAIAEALRNTSPKSATNAG